MKRKPKPDLEAMRPDELQPLIEGKSLTPSRASQPTYADALTVADWYKELIDALENGQRLPEKWTAEEGKKYAKKMWFHASFLESQVEIIEGYLSARRSDIDYLRGLLEPDKRQATIEKHGVAFVEREEAKIRQELEFLEIGQTRVMLRNIGAQAFCAGLSLGYLGARIGVDPALVMAQRASDRGSRGGIKSHGGEDAKRDREHRNEVMKKWNESLKLTHPEWTASRREAEISRLAADEGWTNKKGDPLSVSEVHDILRGKR